ncbi:GNAT family N-acetyltransferase [Blastopirellula marina]|uniref:GNAT family N-acetyltransferase n=1 Tax=Blastopirellula marina TaxID=124 RepID=UPI0013049066|nr:GNAT family N-acetyltransferase [Blastopirellula marina]
MIQLIEIGPSGLPDAAIEASELIQSVCQANQSLYQKTGFHPPWIAYLAQRGDDLVGTCAFKSPPREGKVEVAYCTFPEYEGQGIATWMTGQLIAIGHQTSPDTIITANTLPQRNASTSILEKLGFNHVGKGHDDEVGTTWFWELAPGPE